MPYTRTASARRGDRFRVPGTPESEFLLRWALLTLTGAALLTTADALLLQRDRNLFTGGFLSPDYLDGATATAGFLGASMLADGSVLGLPAAIVMWVLSRSRLRASVCGAAALLAGCVPLLVADVLSYQLLHYLGDAADLSLMIDLTGGDLSELLAVASAHLIAPALLVVTVGTAAGGLIWLIHRFAGGGPARRAAVGVLAAPVILCGVGLTVNTAASVSSDVIEEGLRRKPAGKVLAFVAERLTDIDGDGFGVAARLADPEPFNGSVFPYAADFPGNGIDENGVGGDQPPGRAPFTERAVPATPWVRRPDVVLIVLESFRADLVGSRHDGRAVTPVLDALAAQGVSSRRAYSHNGYTAQSRYHLLSGRLAGPGDGRTLVDDFRRNGYLVGYFSGQDESFGAAEYRVGFDRAHVSYDARVEPARRYSTFTTAGSLAVPFTVVQEHVNRFLRQARADTRPLFLYVNFHDTHFPYSHESIRSLVSSVRLPRSGIAPDQQRALRAMYANTAANVDRAVGEVLDEVRTARGAEPAIIVTADHGESLFDGGFLGHGYALNEVQTRVPLVAANLPLVIDEPFGQGDLRGALADALLVPHSAEAAPRRQAEAGRRIFQYLGTLNRPRQVAFLGQEGRIIYDFRNRRVQIADGAWRRPEDLTPPEHAGFLDLIHQWEQMVLARRSVPAHVEASAR